MFIVRPIKNYSVISGFGYRSHCFYFLESKKSYELDTRQKFMRF